MFGVYSDMTSFLDFLSAIPSEFNFIEGEGASHVAHLAEGQDFLAELTNYAASTNQALMQRPTLTVRQGPPSPARKRSRMLERLARVMHDFTVLRLPEGFGKSSMVAMLAGEGRKVVFVAKTNEQLVEQERSFRERWPELRIHRHKSKARNLQEAVHERLGFWFDPVYFKSRSSYGAVAIDEASTRQALRAALDANGFQHVDHVQLFDVFFQTWRAPRIIGCDVDVVLITLAAFQGLGTSKFKPWWNHLGLLTGYKRVYEQEETHWAHRLVVRNEEEVPTRNQYGQRQRTGEIGLPNITVVIDDPHRNDFDFRRLVEDEDALELRYAVHVQSERKKAQRYVQHWLELGMPALLAQQLAAKFNKEAHAHEMERAQGRYFEARPEHLQIGYGLRRGYAPDDATAPNVVVLTTEHITARLAYQTFKNVCRGSRVSMVDNIRESVIPNKRTGMKAPNLFMPIDQRPSTNCHVTLLATRLVRREHKALLLLIYMALREEFPGDDLTFIGDAMGLDLNLTNNRGRNDLADKNTLIKLSVPNREVALHLWAQFQGSEHPKRLNTVLLADLANQAIGRNQGNRWRGQTCTALVDPMYAGLLEKSELLRYTCTPWSTHAAVGNIMHGNRTKLEKRLAYFLEGGRAMNELGISQRGYGFAQRMNDTQWAIYRDWLVRHKVVYPTQLERADA